MVGLIIEYELKFMNDFHLRLSMHLRIVPPLLMLAFLPAQAQTSIDARLGADAMAYEEGMSLNKDQVLAVEKTLAGSPDDLSARLKLLGHYSLNKGVDENFNKHLLWMVDHHPNTVIFGPIGAGMIALNWHPSRAFMNEYREHWEKAAAAYPKDSAVLLHAAGVVSESDGRLAIEYARKSVEADAGCINCRNQLGLLIGNVILRLQSNLGTWTCLPSTPDIEQTVSNLRKEIESSRDAEIVLDAGMTIKGYSGLYGSQCGGNSDEAARLGNSLIRKAVSLNPSLIDRRHLQDLLKSSDGAWDNVRKGIKAYEEKKRDEAAQFLEKAIERDPGIEIAHMYLATIYASRFDPDSADPKSNEIAYKAIEAYKYTIDNARIPADSINAMLGIAGLYYQLKNYPESKAWCNKILKINPAHAEAYYRIAVIDYNESLEKTGIQGEKIKLLTLDERATIQAIVDEGLKYMGRSLEIRPNYLDAAAFQKLLLVEKSKLEK